jgi:hypothetical protein
MGSEVDTPKQWLQDYCTALKYGRWVPTDALTAGVGRSLRAGQRVGTWEGRRCRCRRGVGTSAAAPAAPTVTPSLCHTQIILAPTAQPALFLCRSFKPFTLTERKARAATRNKPWGPTGTQLAMLGELTLSPTDCAAILGVVELRLGYPPQKWRNVYKGLTVLEYLLRHGSDACVDRARRGLLPRLEALSTGFNHVGADGRDMGVNVRHRWVLAAGSRVPACCMCCAACGACVAWWVDRGALGRSGGLWQAAAVLPRHLVPRRSHHARLPTPSPFSCSGPLPSPILQGSGHHCAAQG